MNSINLIEAKLIKKISDNGYWITSDNIPAGKIYTVDKNSIRTDTFFNVPHGTSFEAEVIDIYENGKPVGFFPTELLELKDEVIEANDNNNAVAH